MGGWSRNRERRGQGPPRYAEQMSGYRRVGQPQEQSPWLRVTLRKLGFLARPLILRSQGQGAGSHFLLCHKLSFASSAPNGPLGKDVRSGGNKMLVWRIRFQGETARGPHSRRPVQWMVCRRVGTPVQQELQIQQFQ